MDTSFMLSLLDDNFEIHQINNLFNKKDTSIVNKIIQIARNPKKNIKKRNRCKICHKVYLPSMPYKYGCEHIDRQPFKCPTCHQAFRQRAHLQSHMRRHTGEKPYECDVCGKAFTQQSQLTGHKRIHGDVRPYECSVCSRAFRMKCTLTRHMRVHTSDKALSTDETQNEATNNTVSAASILNENIEEVRGRNRNKCKICHQVFRPSMPNRYGCEHIDKEPFKCPTCHQTFKQLAHLQIHTRTHTGEKPYVCDVCGKAFAQKSHFTGHMRIHGDVRPYECSVCSKAFRMKGTLTRHMSIHTSDKSTDETQNETTDNTDSFSHTLTRARKRSHVCDVCGKAFRQHSHLTGHKRIHDDVRPYQCSVCSRPFRIKSSLNRHMRIHSRHKSLSTNETLNKTTNITDTSILSENNPDHRNQNQITNNECHQLILPSMPDNSYDDIEERPFKCPTCDQTFKQLAHLRVHMRVHTGERPYSCDVCGKAFARHSHLIGHRRIHGDVRPYECSVCSRAFRVKSNLSRHMSIHTSDKFTDTDAYNFECPTCHQRFKQPAYLRIHMRRHTGEKPYVCDVCGKAFVQHSHLTEHKRIHDDVRPYECSLCSRAFRVKSALTRHMRIHTMCSVISANVKLEQSRM